MSRNRSPIPLPLQYTILFFVIGYGLYWLSNQPATEQIASDDAAHKAELRL